MPGTGCPDHGTPMRDGKNMITQNHLIKRLICALCAAALLAGALPTAWAADTDMAAPVQALTAAQVQQMQQADQAVTALTDSPDYAALSVEDRTQAARQQLEDLVDRGLVEPGSIYLDQENGMMSFAYTCGALGGILLQDPDQENAALEFQAQPELEQAAENAASGSAVIYYAFDNTVNSSRYPNYVYMQTYWNGMGLDTKLDTNVTVSDLRHMDDFDLCILSTHGAYYTYEYGRLWKRTATQPVLLLAETSSFWNDLRYGMDLLTHRIIKVNGAYAVTGGFFQAAYRNGSLRGTMVLSETCEFYGRSGSLDTSIADALLAGGADCVMGYINNVYAVYARSMLWATVNRLLCGDTLAQAVDFSLDRYGADDLIWYSKQGRNRPHPVASYPIISGNRDARLEAFSTAGQQAA